MVGLWLLEVGLSESLVLYSETKKKTVAFCYRKYIEASMFVELQNCQWKCPGGEGPFWQLIPSNRRMLSHGPCQGFRRWRVSHQRMPAHSSCGAGTSAKVVIAQSPCDRRSTKQSSGNHTAEDTFLPIRKDHRTLPRQALIVTYSPNNSCYRNHHV